MFAGFRSTMTITAVATTALLCAACSGEPTPPTTPPIANPTLVSLNPCLDALLLEIADPAQILALSHYSLDPDSSSVPVASARAIGVTGGTAEEVIALNPDIVLASTFITPTKRGAFERLGITVETFASPATVAQSQAQIDRIGSIAGRTRQAGAAAKSVAGDPQSLPADAPSALIWQPGQIVPGERTLISELLREAGFSSHSAARGLSQADYVSLETLLADPPDLVLVAGSNTGQRHPALRALTNTRIEPFDPKLLYCGGPTITAARDRLAAIRASM